MHIGSHFGKRKPRWNFFESFISDLKNNHQDKIKFLVNFILVQAIMLSPLLYWSLENYSFIEKHFNVPLHLKNALDIEKKWVIIVYCVTLVLSSIMCFKFIYDLTKKENSYSDNLKSFFNSEKKSNIESATSPDAAADRRHVS